MRRGLEEGKEYWVKMRLDVVDDDETTLIPYRFSTPESNAAHWFPEDIEAVEATPEREKVTIPKFMDDWIEECIEYDYDLADSLEGGINDSYKEVQEWLGYRKNQDTFARAWLYGYEVEEPLGVLLLDLPEKGYWEYNYVRIYQNEKFFVDGSHKTSLLVENAHKVTEAEAKEKYPNFKWVSLEELENDL